MRIAYNISEKMTDLDFAPILCRDGYFVIYQMSSIFQVQVSVHFFFNLKEPLISVIRVLVFLSEKAI